MTIWKFDDPGCPAWPDLLETAPLIVLYKHSPACMTSSVAQREIIALNKTRPDIPIYQVDVIHSRALAHRIAADLQVRHESPQVLVVRDGRAAWHTSHFAVKAAALVAQIERMEQAHATMPPPCETDVEHG